MTPLSCYGVLRALVHPELLLSVTPLIEGLSQGSSFLFLISFFFGLLFAAGIFFHLI